jgi:Domain of unknown function (DUF932)
MVRWPDQILDSGPRIATMVSNNNGPRVADRNGKGTTVSRTRIFTTAQRADGKPVRALLYTGGQDPDCIVAQSRSMSRAYRTVDAPAIRTAFERHGLTVQEQGYRTRKNLFVTEPGAGKAPGEYVARVQIHLDHSGRSAVRLQGGLFRLICSNGAALPIHAFGRAIRHTSQEIDQFLADPVQFVAPIWGATQAIPRVLERLKQGDSELVDRAEPFRARMIEAAPRVAHEARERALYYADEMATTEGERLWALYQGLTDPRGSYMPGRQRLATDFLATLLGVARPQPVALQ